MKIKLGVLVLVSLLVVGIASISLASGNSGQVGFMAHWREEGRQCVPDFLEGLSPSQQQEIEEAWQDYRARIHELREQSRSDAEQAWESFYNMLPEQLQERVDEGISLRQQWRERFNRGGGRFLPKSGFMQGNGGD